MPEHCYIVPGVRIWPDSIARCDADDSDPYDGGLEDIPAHSTVDDILMPHPAVIMFGLADHGGVRDLQARSVGYRYVSILTPRLRKV